MSYCRLRFHSLLLAFIAIVRAQINNIPAPKNVKVVSESVTDTEFWVTWEFVSKADSYKVVLSPPEIGASGVGNGITDKFTAIGGLAPDTEYKVTIIPVKGSDQGTPAVVVQRTALPAPSSLFVVSDTVSATQFVVGWAKVDGAQSYTLEINPSTGISGAGRGLYKTNANLLGLTPNTLYSITVRAINWVGLGAATTIRQLTKLPAPSNVRVVSETISHNTMSVHWDPVVGADTYEVAVSPGEGVRGAGQGITETYVILRNLQADTQYRVQVASTNGAGLSEYKQAIAKTLSVCFAKGMDFTEDVFTVRCPPRCARNQEHVYGTREYTADSYICAAAVHDGRIDDNIGGEVVVKKRPGLPHYVGTTKHGVVSQDYGSWHQSFVFGLQIPQNFRVQPGSVRHNSFTVLWDGVSGADAYRIAIQPGFGVVGARPGIEGTKATLSNMRSNIEYTVYLTATNTLETSEASILKQFTALAGPPRVEVIPESVTHDRMNISWFPVIGATHYVLEVSAGTTPFKHESKRTSTTIDGLMSGTKYRIAVRAANSVGPGGATIVSQYTKLSTPTNVEAESVNWQRMHIQWDAVPGATHYVITTVPTNPRNTSLTTTKPWIWIENLISDTMYEIWIQAENEHEKSKSISIRQMTALGQPRDLVVSSKTHNSVTLTWNRVKNSDSYFVTIVSTDGRQAANDEIKANKVTLTDLDGRTEYKVKVVGRNKIGDGQPSTLGVTTLIPPPSNLVVRGSTSDPTQIEVTWSQMPESTGYYITVSPQGDISGTGMVTENRGVVGGLRSGISYTLNVMAVIGAERGMNATATFATGLPSPSNVRVHRQYIKTNSLFIVWGPVSLAKYYNLTYQNMRTKEINTIRLFTNASMLLQGLDPGTTYLITVYAMGISRYGGRTTMLGSVGATTVGRTMLESPVDLKTLKTTDSSVTIGWSPVAFATHYVVYIRPFVGVNGTGKHQSTEVTLSGLKRGEDYVTWVRAVNAENNATSLEQEIVINTVVPVTSPPEIFYEDDDPDPPLGGNMWDTPSDTDVNSDPGHNEYDPNLKQPKQEEESSWIVIVIIVIVIGLLILLGLLPCCCDCLTKKPMLKCSGFCGCCAPCSDAGCCGCVGCCNASHREKRFTDDDDAGYPMTTYTPRASLRDTRMHSRQPYLVHH